MSEPHPILSSEAIWPEVKKALGKALGEKLENVEEINLSLRAGEVARLSLTVFATDPTSKAVIETISRYHLVKAKDMKSD